MFPVKHCDLLNVRLPLLWNQSVAWSPIIMQVVGIIQALTVETVLGPASSVAVVLGLILSGVSVHVNF